MLGALPGRTENGLRLCEVVVGPGAARLAFMS